MVKEKPKKKRTKKVRDFSGFPTPKMIVRIRDVLFVNTLERHLGRALTKEEVDIEKFEGEVGIYVPPSRRYDVSSFLKLHNYVINDNGIAYLRFPRLILPEDLMTVPGL